jgi:hypothetical protein
MKSYTIYMIIKSETPLEELNSALERTLAECKCSVQYASVTVPFEEGTPGLSKAEDAPVRKMYEEGGMIFDGNGKSIGMVGESGGPGNMGINVIDNTDDFDPLITCGRCGFRGYQRDLDLHVCKSTIL